MGSDAPVLAAGELIFFLADGLMVHFFAAQVLARELEALGSRLRIVHIQFLQLL